MEYIGLIVLILLVRLVVVVLAKSVALIPQAEAAVIERLGRYTRTVSGQLTLLLPFIDRIRARVGQEVGVPNYPAEGGVKLSAGWLIERAGFSRGYPGADAPVRLSTKHTLALTNRGDASTAQLLELARDVRDGVDAAFGVRLHPEPVLINCSI